MKKLLLLGALGMIAAASQADTLTLNIDLAGAQSVDELYDVDNFGLYANLDVLFGNDYSDYTVDLIEWENVAFHTVDGDINVPGGVSWLEEAILSVENTGGTNFADVQFAPGLDGPGSVSNLSGSIAGGGAIDADDMIFIHLWEGFDDYADAADALYDSGTVTITLTATNSAVPEPASLAVLGLGALALVRRKKSNK